MKRDYSEEQPTCLYLSSVTEAWCLWTLLLLLSESVVCQWFLSFMRKNVNQFISRKNIILAIICGVGIVLVVKFIVPVSFKKWFVLFFSKIFLEICDSKLSICFCFSLFFKQARKLVIQTLVTVWLFWSND